MTHLVCCSADSAGLVIGRLAKFVSRGDSCLGDGRATGRVRGGMYSRFEGHNGVCVRVQEYGCLQQYLGLGMWIYFSHALNTARSVGFMCSSVNGQEVSG